MSLEPDEVSPERKRALIDWLRTTDPEGLVELLETFRRGGWLAMEPLAAALAAGAHTLQCQLPANVHDFDARSWKQCRGQGHTFCLTHHPLDFCPICRDPLDPKP